MTVVRYIPIRRVASLDLVDDGECVEGYLDGFRGDPEPMGNRSLSYWHGWRNGAVDGGHRAKDEAQAELACDNLSRARA